MHNSKRPALVGVSLLVAGFLAGGAAVAGAADGAATNDGFATLLAARDAKNAPAADQELPPPNPVAKLRTPTMVQAPMWSVIRAHYAPNGELVWGCTIEHRPLIERPGNRIPD